MDFITAAEVASLLEVSVTAALTDAVVAVQAEFMQECGRTFIREERTAYPFSLGGPSLWLPEAPIHDVLEVRVDPTGRFQPGTVIADTPEAITRHFKWVTSDGDRTSFRLDYLSGHFPSGANTVMVRFVAGYWSFTDTDEEHAAGKPPEDLRRRLKKAAAIESRSGMNEKFASQSISGVESFTRFDSDKHNPLQQAINRYSRPM